uniref:Uncharacterized protein n=1 Tax=Meloidogyne floridensis TaxID=298350 RepID=A0A915NVP5_9BILA
LSYNNLVKYGCGECSDDKNCIKCHYDACISHFRDHYSCLADHDIPGAWAACKKTDKCFITKWGGTEGRFWGGCGKCDPNKHCYDCEGKNCNTVDKFKDAFYCYIRDSNDGNIKLGNIRNQNDHLNKVSVQQPLALL